MKLGGLDISTVKLGTNQVQAVYQGSNLVWQNAPVATAATGVGQTSFTANWNAYSGATYYLLDVSESSDFSTFVYENQITTSTSYVVIGLNSNTTYYYRVRASTEAYDPDYEAVINYAISQGYNLPSYSQQLKQNQLVLDLKDGGIWSKLDTFAVFATDGDEDFALIDWKTLTQYTAVNSPTFTTNAGFNGNATSSYINSNFNPLNDSIHMQTNDASFGMYIKTAGTITNRGHGNFSTANGAGIYLNPNGTGAVRIWMNSGGVFSGNNLNRVGFYQIDRSSSLNVNYIKNGVQIENTTIDSTFRPDGNLYFLASLIGSSAGDFNDDQLSLVYAGSSLNSEKANFNNAVNTYITSL